jgi:hypothetical protein
VPTAKVVLFALVMAGAWSTISVKDCVPFGVTPLAALIVIGYVPPVVAAGVPLSVPSVPRVTPLGNVPVSLKVIGVGKPVAVTANVPAAPTVKVAVFTLVIVGGWFTVSVKACDASGAMPLVALITMEYVPPVPAAGVPLSTPPELRLTPVGRAPVPLKVDPGKPEAVTVKVPELPVLKVAWFRLVMEGASSTVSVKFCVAFGKVPLLAVIVNGNVPPVPVAGVPLSVAVPVPLSTKVTPLGRLPLSDKAAFG